MQANKVVGIPEGLDLKKLLNTATRVKIAVAFATEGGWTQIENEVLSGHKAIDIIVGLNSEITDPRLLDKWFKLAKERSGSFHVFVAPLDPMFHPKLLIGWDGTGSGFAIVGSGNLTFGGQNRNVECAVLVRERRLVDEIDAWFKEIECVPLSVPIINNYRLRCGAVSKFRARTAGSTAGLKRMLESSRAFASLLCLNWQKDRFINDLLGFLNSAVGSETLQNRVEAASRIRGLLHIPKFDFSRSEWEEFYGILEFGRIRPVYKEMSEETPRLRRAFKFLLSRPIDVNRLRTVLHVGQKRHVLGLGANLISKVLTVHDKRRWPLVNDRVVTAMAVYGYHLSQDAKGYIAFAQDMRTAQAGLENVDFWGLDAFCEVKSRKLDNPIGS
jgi:hypothetical protein